ncbi:hypothetical protein HK098_002076 [Nowakowskiella sp. JEL0407]|nr:hypothetical protein HK098_002076 [Nowakowskiella sp. JEL0407]
MYFKDLTSESLPEHIEPGSIDVCLCIFVLSALHPNSWSQAIGNLEKLLKPGGRVLFRDYGRYDLAQLRFKGDRLLEDNLYVRGDGTRAYFFTQEEIAELFGKNFTIEQNAIDRRLIVNRARKIKMYRPFVGAKMLTRIAQTSRKPKPPFTLSIFPRVSCRAFSSAFISVAPYRLKTRITVPNKSKLIASYSTDKLKDQFIRDSHDYLDILCRDLEELLDEFMDKPGYDVVLSSGVLTVKLAHKGTYVINTQPANFQIWVSSPVSGPRRFEVNEGKWFDIKNEEIFLDTLLKQEISTLLQ